ncbi:hypothetical protein ABTX80_28110 [Streptomyces erythrochromogenes]|uniref:hypothetical protein n=1 Tax=Streptomyces erythrochromogenes TaxID=285574 RepID=UPI0033251E02
MMRHPDFTRHGTTDRASLDERLAMAWTGSTLATDPAHHIRLLARPADRART